MDRINPVSSTGAVPKQIAPQTQKDTHQGRFSKQVPKVESRSAATADPMADSGCSSSTPKQLSSSRQSDLEFGSASVSSVRPVHPSTSTPMAIGKATNQRPSAHAKSFPTSFDDHQINSDPVTRVMPETSHSKKFYIAESTNALLKNSQKKFDLGPNLERKEDFIKLIDKHSKWYLNIIAKKNTHRNPRKTKRTKQKIMPPYIYNCFCTLDIFHKDNARDEEFVQIVDGYTSFVRINATVQKEISELAKAFAHFCCHMKQRLDSGEEKEVISSVFEDIASAVFRKYLNPSFSFGVQCKVVSEIRKNGFDMTDSFRKLALKTFPNNISPN